MRRSRVLLCAMRLAGAAMALSSLSRAQPVLPGNDRIAAEALFEEGRNLVAAGKVADACPKFADSQRLDPAPGTLLNLASCWERLGRTASAWVTYKEAASAANALGRADYVTTAQRHAESLAPRLARITVNVPQPVDGLELRRDGVVVSSVEWGQAVPVDPGTHMIQARAPGHVEWTVAAAALDGSQVSVTVPLLEASPAASLPAPAPAPATAPEAPAAPTAAVVAEAPASRGGSQQTTGLVVGSIGVAGLVVAGTFAYFAKTKYDDSVKDCEPTNPNLCKGTGFNQRGEARTYGDVASVAFAVGAPALVAGGILWLLGGQRPQPRTAAHVDVVPVLGGAVVQGAW